MRLAVPIVDLVDGDVILAREDQHGVRIWATPMTVAVAKTDSNIVYYIFDNGKRCQLKPIAYPPGVKLHIARGEDVSGASPKPNLK